MPTLPFLTALCATYNRHYHLERTLRYFLDQDYEGEQLLIIYNNNPVAQELGKIKMPPNKRIFLINNSLDKQTGRPYTNLGAIYRDALTYVPPLTDVLTLCDDDDTFLPYHFSEGVKGWLRARELGKKAYKPEQSYFRGVDWQVSRAGNTLEPSIFVCFEHVKQYGYSLSTVDQHLQWLDPLREKEEILIDPQGKPSFIYNWMGDVWKTSGAGMHEHNFRDCRNFDGELGDRILDPAPPREVAPYYKLV